MIAHLLIRVLLILLGYGLATVASGVTVGLVFAFVEETMASDMPELIMLAIMLIGIYAALPALLAVTIGEVRTIQHRLYYIAAATLIGMALPVVVGLERWYILVGLGFGPVAGLIYWFVAGQRAGLQVRAPA
jgi:hypothetical protein